MKKEIIINSAAHEIRIAIVEDGDLVETLIERADSRHIVGNIYRGVVNSVKPGLQAAFIDIGMEKAGFLHASDLYHSEDGDEDGGDEPGGGSSRGRSSHSGRSSRGGRGGRGGRSSGRRQGRSQQRGRGRNQNVPDIARSLKVGDEILVQVTKEQIGTKGCRLTADLSLPGRFLVHMPKGRHIGVSRKIADRRERVRLKQVLQSVRPDTGAFIIRTAAEGAADKALAADVKYLADLWARIDRADDGEQKAPCLVHEDVGMVVGLIRDIFNEDIDQLVIDDKQDYQRLITYVSIFAPELKNRIKFYKKDLPIFDEYEIEPEIRKSLDKRVWMKKGGYLIIEQTEALVSIDVNTGRFVGKKNQEETIFQTNMIAAREVARQLRLRDIGGIIVTDFIDMENESNKKRVLNELRQHLKRDRARHKVFAVSGLGLIEMSRQRVRPSLQSQLSDPCPYCAGTGNVLSFETMSNRIERLTTRVAVATREKHLQIQANPVLALYLLEEKGVQFRDLCRNMDLEVNVLDDASLHVEEFKIVSLNTEKDLIAEFEKKTRSRRGSRGGRGKR